MLLKLCKLSWLIILCDGRAFRIYLGTPRVVLAFLIDLSSPFLLIIEFRAFYFELYSLTPFYRSVLTLRILLKFRLCFFPWSRLNTFRSTFISESIGLTRWFWFRNSFVFPLSFTPFTKFLRLLVLDKLCVFITSDNWLARFMSRRSDSRLLASRYGEASRLLLSLL